jgi:predicted metal-binding protein
MKHQCMHTLTLKNSSCMQRCMRYKCIVSLQTAKLVHWVIGALVAVHTRVSGAGVVSLQ